MDFVHLLHHSKGNNFVQFCNCPLGIFFGWMGAGDFFLLVALPTAQISLGSSSAIFFSMNINN